MRLLGRPAWGSPEVFHRVGLCPEPDAFWEDLTGLQFLVGLLRLTGYDDAECERRALEALETVALADAKDRKIGGYSKGMRQRVKIAQAIAHEPDVLLLDEPVSGLDPVNRRRVIDLIKRLGREGSTVVVSSHILLRGRGAHPARAAHPQRPRAGRGRRPRDPRSARRASAHGGAQGQGAARWSRAPWWTSPTFSP